MCKIYDIYIEHVQIVSKYYLIQIIKQLFYTGGYCNYNLDRNIYIYLQITKMYLHI